MLKESTPLTSVVLASIQFRLDGAVRWIIGVATILASWPYAYFVMMQVDIWLCAMSPGLVISPVRKLMLDWGLLEWGSGVDRFCCLLLVRLGARTASCD